MARLGLILVAPAIGDQVALAQRAEKAGFHSVWVTEFFNAHGFVRLGAVAAETSKVELGTAIAYAFMRTPMLAAAAAMDLDEISGGRVILGLGSGTRTMNEKWYSSPFDDPPAPRMREAVKLVRSAIAAQGGGGLEFDGEYYSIRIPQYERKGAVRTEIPIYVAAVNKYMIRAAATSDGLVGHPIFTRKYIAESVLPELEGRDCELAPYVITSVSDDPDQARREAKAQIAFYYSTRLYHTVLDAHGWRPIGEEIAAAFRKRDFPKMVACVTDEMLDSMAAAGRPDEVRDRLKQWEELSDHLLVYPASAGASAERLRENGAAIVDALGGD